MRHASCKSTSQGGNVVRIINRSLGSLEGKDEDELTSRSFVGSSLAMTTKRVDNKLISSYGTLQTFSAIGRAKSRITRCRVP